MKPYTLVAICLSFIFPASAQPNNQAESPEFPPTARKRPWGPEQACGAPDTTVLGDVPTAWASQLPNAGIEWLELTYDREVEISELIIYESDNPGALTKVVALKSDGSQAPIWQGKAPAHNWTEQAPRPLKLAAEGSVRSKTVRVYLDTALVDGWNEIDAVELIGGDGTRQWAREATASSSFAAMMAPFQAAWQTPWPAYDAKQATGPPNTPQMCDCPTAWASEDPDGGAEWLQVSYSNTVEIAAVNIYENLHPGAISKVIALPENAPPHVIWEGAEPIPPVRQGPAAIYTVEPEKPVRAKKIKIELDTKRVAGWNEIDAVQLVGTDGSRQWAIDAEASSSFGRGTFPMGRPFAALATMPGVGTERLNDAVQRLTERIAELERRIQSMEATSSPPTVVLRARTNQPANWQPEQACGAPDTPMLGDYTSAWASQQSDGGAEWLELLFDKPGVISQIHIYESYNPGAITSVVALVQGTGPFGRPPGQLPGGNAVARTDGFIEIPLWSGASPRAPANARMTQVFVVRPELPQQPIQSARIRIYLNTQLVPSWNEIDAVELVTADGQRQWASKAAASSTYGAGTTFAKRLDELVRGFTRPPVSNHLWSLPRVSPPPQLSNIVRQYGSIVEDFQTALKAGRGGLGNRPIDPTIPRRRDQVNAWNWGPEQVCGPPDTPSLGDYVTAWAPRSSEGGSEWLQLGYDREVEIAELVIYESCGPGAITKVMAGDTVLASREQKSNWRQEGASGRVRVNRISVQQSGVKSSRIRIELDTRLEPGWNEIDAVELIGKDGSRQWATEASASSSYAD